MKELSIEEKAKAYDEALKEAVIAHKDEDRHLKATLERIFPELKESEDERIRKALLRFHASTIDIDGIQGKEILAWLEKQGEKSTDKVEPKDYNSIDPHFCKPIDKVEPNFSVGQWVVQENIGVYKIIEVCESWYEVVDNKDKYYSIGFDKEYMCHLWDITKDAKDGDVLYAGGSHCYFKEYIFMFSSFTEDNVISTHFGYDVFHGTFDKDITRFGREEDFTFVTPATKEQRDSLLEAMADAGYIFDFDKKELKKIEQNPTWSEEDEHRVKDTIYFLDAAKKHYASVIELDACIDWLKSLKERVQPQLRWKPRVANR